jgi:hypothetical protein
MERVDVESDPRRKRIIKELVNEQRSKLEAPPSVDYSL